MSTTISEGCPYNVNRQSMSNWYTLEGCPYNVNRRSMPIDIHRRVVHKIDYRSVSTIYIGGLSTGKQKYLCLKMVFIHGKMHV